MEYSSTDNLRNGSFFDDEGILFVFLFNLILSLILILLFSFFRKRKITKNKRLSSSSPLLIFSQPNPHDISHLLDTNSNFFSWFITTYRMDENEVYERSGYNALLYLKFLKYMILLCFIYCIGSITIILPINLSGNQSPSYSFSVTTISNLEIHSNKLWAHALLVGIYSIFAFMFIFRFRQYGASIQTAYSKTLKEEKHPSLTVCVKGIPKDIHDENLLKENFEKIFPQQIFEARIAFDITEGSYYDKKKSEYFMKWKSYHDKYSRTGERKKILRYSSCVDALSYYEKEFKIYGKKFEAWKSSPHQGTGYAFITFTDKETALSSLSKHRLDGFDGMDQKLNSHAWQLSMATPPTDISWTYLGIEPTEKFFRVIVINAAILLGLFLLVLPVPILSTLYYFSDKPHEEMLYSLGLASLIEANSNLGIMLCKIFLFSYIPSFLLFLIVNFIPYLLIACSYFEGHKFFSVQENYVIKKSFFIMVLFVIIVPNIILIYLNYLIQKSGGTGDISSILQTIFFPNFGAFFVNYLLTTTFLGNALGLFRLSRKLKALCTHFRLPSENLALATGSKIEPFPFGLNYSISLCTISVILAFSCSVPLIVPIGLVYFTFKFLVDKYRICFIHPRIIHGSKPLLSTVRLFLLGCVILFQLGMTFFFFFREKYVEASILLVVAIVCISFYIFLGNQKEKFRRKLMANLDEIYTNRNETEIKNEAVHEEQLQSLKEYYVHSLFKNQSFVDNFISDDEEVSKNPPNGLLDGNEQSSPLS